MSQRDDQNKSMLLNEAASAVKIGKVILIGMILLLLFSLLIAVANSIGGNGY